MTRRVPSRTGGGQLRASNHLDALEAAGDDLTRLETETAKARARVQAMILEAYEDHNVSPAKLGRLLGMSRQRVWQIIEKQRQRKGAAA